MTFREEQVRIGYYRFQFRCGCEFLTTATSVNDMQTEMSCPRHQVNDCWLFGLDTEGYWRPLAGNDLLGPIVDFPASYGLHPEEKRFGDAHLDRIDVEKLREDEKREHRGEVSGIADALLMPESADTKPQDREFLLQFVAKREPEMLTEVREAIELHRRLRKNRLP